MNCNTLPACKRRSLPGYCTFAALLLSGASQAAVHPGDLAITEVMANPANVNDSQGEWFEIYNRSGMELELSGLVLRDDGSNTHTVDAPVTLAADSYMVLGRNADTGTNGGYASGYEYNSFTLSNGADEIILEFDGQVVDSLVYDDGDTFGMAGVSAELTRSGFAATPANFVYGDGDIGTPGNPGSDPGLDLSAPSPVPLPGAAWLLASGLGGLFIARRRQS